MNGEIKNGSGNVVPTIKKMSAYTDPNAVHYKPDAKTEVQKEQARQNIGAADAKTQAAHAEQLAEHEKTIAEHGEEVAEHDVRMTQMEARMNTFASLSDGSTTGDAEIADIRVGYDGKTYPTAGEAVRAQVGRLSEEIGDCLTLNSSKSTPIVSGTDLNDVLDIGVYSVANSSVATTLINCPSTLGGNLIVMSVGGSNNRKVQYYITAYKSTRIYFRYYGGEWTEWDYLTKNTDVEDTINNVNKVVNTLYVYDALDCCDIGFGGLYEADGVWFSSQKRLYTIGYIPIDELTVTVDDTIKIDVYAYDKYKKYLGPSYINRGSAIHDEEYEISKEKHPEAAFVKLMIKFANDDTIPFSEYDYAHIREHFSVYGNSSHRVRSVISSDVPENIGVLNAIRRAKQICGLEWTTQAEIPIANDDDIGADQTIRGMLYSNAYYNMGFAPNYVSYHTYLSSLLNRNSYIYTVDTETLYGQKKGAFYGIVCSAFAGYCLGLKYHPTTHRWEEIPGNEKIEHQSVYGIKLGDTLCIDGEHVILVIDIKRDNRGRIYSITTAEATSSGEGVTRTRVYSPELFETLLLDKGYIIYRYKYLYQVDYTESPYVAVEDEAEQVVTWNTTLIPRKGDKANYLPGEDIVIDVLERGDYTQAEIYKDAALHETISIPDSNVINLTGLSYGKYTIRLTNGTNHSDYCCGVVVDANVTPMLSGSDVIVNFTSANAKPVMVMFTSYNTHGMGLSYEITDSDASNGTITIPKQSDKSRDAIRVGFRTEYGTVFSEPVKFAE